MAGSSDGKWSGRALLLAGAGAAVAVAAAAGFWARDRAVEKELAEARARADAALSAVITPETLAEADKSVYKAYTDKLQGTAFVIDRARGVLATAAHLAEGFDDAAPNMKIVNRFTGKPVAVKAVRMHKGYRALDAVIGAYAPLDPDSDVKAPRLADILSNPLDVALLFVDPLDPKTGENILGPDLRIAPESAVKALKPGDVVAILGFPGDAMSGTIGEESVSSRVEKGVVGALISPVDHRAFAKDPDTAFLIASRMELVGGNSGGPLINRAGEVVGVSAQGRGRDGVAQRADLLLDLLDPVREASRYADLYLPDWKRRLEAFPKAADSLPAVQYLRFHRGVEPDPQKPAPTKVGEIDLKIARPFATASRDVQLASISARFVSRAADLETGAFAAATSTGAAQSGDVTAGPLRGFVFDKPGQYASTLLQLDPARTHAVTLWDAGLVNGQGGCTLEVYFRRVGDAVFRGPLSGRLVTAVMRARDGAAGGDVYEAVIRRPLCRASGARITLSVTSWTDGPAAPAAARIVQTARFDRDSGPPSLLRETAAAVQCGLASAPDYRCAPPLHAVPVGKLPENK